MHLDFLKTELNQKGIDPIKSSLTQEIKLLEKSVQIEENSESYWNASRIQRQSLMMNFYQPEFNSNNFWKITPDLDIDDLLKEMN